MVTVCRSLFTTQHFTFDTFPLLLCNATTFTLHGQLFYNFYLCNFLASATTLNISLISGCSVVEGALFFASRFWLSFYTSLEAVLCALIFAKSDYSISAGAFSLPSFLLGFTMLCSTNILSHALITNKHWPFSPFYTFSTFFSLLELIHERRNMKRNHSTRKLGSKIKSGNTAAAVATPLDTFFPTSPSPLARLDSSFDDFHPLG